MTSRRRRLEDELVSRGLFTQRADARLAIEQRKVLIDDAPARTPATLVGPSSKLSVLEDRRYASRGGQKLEGALGDLKVDPSGKRCLDAGAGAGGFTDCLLQHGAGYVVAVDVGYGEFDWRLRNDPRVRLLERTNIRRLTTEMTEGPFDLVVADLSFIGLAQVARPLVNLAADEGSLLLMVKPQHEAPRSKVGEGGIVRDPDVWMGAIEAVSSRLRNLGFGAIDAAPSRLRGAGGNQEFFVLALRGREPRPSAWQRAITAASDISSAAAGSDLA